jgi:hypothetical protein
MTNIAPSGQYLLIRRLISRPDKLSFYLCRAPLRQPATLTCFITIAGRRWPVGETSRIGKGICRQTALAALAQLRVAAIRGALTGTIALHAASSGTGHAGARPLGIAVIRLSITETARLAIVAAHYTAGLMTRARLTFTLRWSLWRRRHQATGHMPKNRDCNTWMNVSY